MYKKTHASTLYHYTSSVIHIYIFTNIWKIENNNGNIKIKETTIGIKHQIIMRAGTIYIFFVSFYCSHHAPFLEVQDRHHCGGLVSWTDHARLSTVCPCAFRCASNIYPRPELLCAFLFYMPVLKNPNPQTEPLKEGGIPSTTISLSTAINKDFFFFVAFPAMWQLCTCYLKLLKDCADVSLNKRPCTHQRVTQHVWI